MNTVACLKQPVPGSEVREHLAIEDQIDCEFIATLTGEGWQWVPWTPPSKRSARHARTYEPYARGKPQVWYSGMSPLRLYMLALLRSQSLFDAGLNKISHNLRDRRYEAMLRRDFRLLLPVLADLPADLEEEGHLDEFDDAPPAVEGSRRH